jgi:UDP-glucuronate 4-epimerase
MTGVLDPFLTNGLNAPERQVVSTYLVTGCAGFIGSHLSEALLERGDAVIGIDAFTDYYPRPLKQANLEHLLAHDAFVFLEADLIDAPLEGLMAGVDGVFHLAAQPGVRGSWGATFDVYARDNLLATQRVFEGAAQMGVRVVYASSSSVYGNAAAYPTTEESPLGPVSPYGVTKLCCERLAEAYAHSRDLDSIGMRYFTVYGPRQRPDMAAQRIALALTGGGRFEVYGNGEQSRDVTYVDDAVSATIAVMETAPGGGVYNVGGGSETSLREIIEICQRVSGIEIDVTYGATATGDVRRTAGDCGRIRDEVGWSPTTSLEDGLTSQLAWTMSKIAWERSAVPAP